MKFKFSKNKTIKKLQKKIILKINDWTGEILTENYRVEKAVKDYELYRKKYHGFSVSNHALMRYFERMEGYDFDEIRDLITRNLVYTQGVSKQKVADMIVVTKNRAVLTIYSQEGNGVLRIVKDKKSQ